MRRKFTVYGLRFSKTSFWNRMNTAFLDPAVATVLTVCGIETLVKLKQCKSYMILVATVLTVCGIETWKDIYTALSICCCNSAYRLRY